MALSLVITDAGHAAIINAQNSGTDAVVLSEVGFGTRTTAPSEGQVGLTGEIKRVDTIAGAATGDKTISVRVTDSSGDTYDASELGVFTDTGVLFAVYAQSTVLVSKSSSASLMLAIDLEFTTDGVVPVVVFGDSNFVLPAATEDVAGSAQIATQAEADAGTDDARIVTPLKLKNRFNALVKSATETIAGIAEIATQSETDAGTDDTRFVTPKKMRWGVSYGFSALNKWGYLVMPSWLGGFCIQCGRSGSIGSEISTTLTYPIAFTSVLTVVSDSINPNDTNDDVFSRVVSITNTQVTLRAEIINNTQSPNRNLTYIAFGVV